MISNKIDDYKVLSILGSEGEFTYYKVQDKVTGIFYQWQAVNYNMDEDLNNALITEILTRKGLTHKNFLKLFDYIYHSKTKTVYIITEYCSSGTFSKVLLNCLKKHLYINESLIWNVLYTISTLIKENMCQIDDISLNNIFLDNSNSVRLLSLRFPGENTFNNCSKEEICPIEQLGTVIYKLCTLECTETCKINFNNIPTYYSQELYDIIEFLLHKTDIQPTIDAILHHPTILVNLPQWGQENKIYVSKNEEQNIRDEKEISADTLERRFEQLKIRESELNIKENKFEYQIKKRERKVILAEKLAKEKLRRAELYLQSAREKRPHVKTENNGKYAQENVSTNIYENINVVKRYSKQKLRVNANVNIANRKIKFKGHSPLKDVKNSQDLIERNCKKKVYIKSSESTDWISDSNSASVVTKPGKTYCTSGIIGVLPKHDLLRKQTNKTECASDQQTVVLRKASPKNKFGTSKRNVTVRRSFINMMFNRASIQKTSKEDERKESEHLKPALIQNYEEIGDFLEEDEIQTCKTEMLGCKALLWTEENKKQAFDMLRVINEEKEDITVIKHTYL